MSKYRLHIALFAICLLVFNLNLRLPGRGDSTPTSLLPFSIALDHSIKLNRFYDWFKEQTPYLYFFSVKDSQVYSSYPIALPVMITPLYLPVIVGLKVKNWTIENIIYLASVMEKIIASLIASLSVVLFFCFLKKIVNQKLSLLLSIIFAVGTSTWSIASQALWQHGPSQLMIISSLFYLKSSFEDENLPNTLLSGLFAALSVAVRPSNIIFLMVSYGCLLFKKWSKRRVLLYSIFPIFVGGLLAYYNYSIFHDIRGYYSDQGYNSFDGDFLAGLAGVLVSPSRGLFIYTPIFIFIIGGIYIWFKEGRKFIPVLYTLSLICVVLHIMLISKFKIWWGGYVYGPRYFTDVLPFLLILLIPSLSYISRQFLVKAIFTLFILVSIFVQIIGTFYPHGRWNDFPVGVYRDLNRLWDWKDPPILRRFLAGPELGIHLKLLGLSKPLHEKDFKVNYGFVTGPKEIVKGSGKIFQVTITNQSERSWYNVGYGTNSINLSYHWYDRKGNMIIWDGHRSKLPIIVKPNELIKTDLFVAAPNQTGMYILKIDLVQEGVSWFSSKGCEPLEIYIKIVPQ